MRGPHKSSPKVLSSEEARLRSESMSPQDGMSGDVDFDLRVKLRFLRHTATLGKALIFIISIVLLILFLWFLMKIGRADLLDKALQVLANLL